MTRASHDQIRSRLRKARRDEAKLLQKPKRYRNRKYKCVGCDPSKPKQICQRLYPPTCGNCVKVDNRAPSVQPDAVAERCAQRLRALTLDRAQGLAPTALVHLPPAMTRACAARAPPRIGVMSLFSAASFLGSQFKGPRYKHLFGVDIDNQYAPSFSRNNDGAPLLVLDILALESDVFLGHIGRFADADMRDLILLVTIDCGLASRANNVSTDREKREFYKAAIDKVKELAAAAERKYRVFLFWEFLCDEFVANLIEDAFPEASSFSCDGHLCEDRKRLYFAMRYDPGMALFKEELAAAIARCGGELCAADGLVRAGLPVPVGSELFSGTWMQRDGGRDPWDRRTPTITTQGLYLKEPTSAGLIKISADVLLSLRMLGADYQFTFAPGDSSGIKDKIVGMGVSAIIAVAARRAFERWVDA